MLRDWRSTVVYEALLYFSTTGPPPSSVHEIKHEINRGLALLSQPPGSPPIERQARTKPVRTGRSVRAVFGRFHDLTTWTKSRP